MSIEKQRLIAEIKARVKIRQLKELEAFDSLRLSIVVTTEVLMEILAEIKAMNADRKNLYVISA